VVAGCHPLPEIVGRAPIWKRSELCRLTRVDPDLCGKAPRNQDGQMNKMSAIWIIQGAAPMVFRPSKCLIDLQELRRLRLLHVSRLSTEQKRGTVPSINPQKTCIVQILFVPLYPPGARPACCASIPHVPRCWIRLRCYCLEHSAQRS
jgi:hypothetical protein